MGITEDVVRRIVPEFFCPTLAQNASFLSFLDRKAGTFFQPNKAET
ncbi:MAG: hypothetical protein F6K40_02000 [Okeania sp. SIO3I5]|nr:hypothetical protein [Okeania sp. SIO3I5]NEQ35146.1 hypothetical protein [Okeania sp. SIO3I5]